MSLNFAVSSQPLGHSAMMGASATPALAEAVGTVSALCSSTLGRRRAALGPRNRLPFAVHVGAIVRAFDICGITACRTYLLPCRGARTGRLRGGLSYELLGKKETQRQYDKHSSQLHEFILWIVPVEFFVF
jgi:hypothetical protein